MILSVFFSTKENRKTEVPLYGYVRDKEGLIHVYFETADDIFCGTNVTWVGLPFEEPNTIEHLKEVWGTQGLLHFCPICFTVIKED